jgi:hypothetical protein
MNIIASAFGVYPGERCPRNYGAVIGYAEGDAVLDDSINAQLASMVDAYADGRTIIVEKALAAAFEPTLQQPDHVLETKDYRDTLRQGKEITECSDLGRVLHIAYNRRIGRILVGAQRIGLPSLAPINLPGFIDKYHFSKSSNPNGSRSRVLQ